MSTNISQGTRWVRLGPVRLGWACSVNEVLEGSTKETVGRVVSPTEGQSRILTLYQSKRNENHMSSLLQFMTMFGTLTRERL